MLFNKVQLDEILSILDYHFLFVISTNFGESLLSKNEINELDKFGLKLPKRSFFDVPYNKMYLLGKLTSILSDEQARSLDYEDFLKYIKRGQYQPLSKLEQSQLEIARRKTYVYLKGLKQKAHNTLESIVLNQESLSRQQYETAIKEETVRGIKERKSLQSIVSDLGHRTNEWGHDWARIVDTEMNNIFQEGRAQSFKEKEEDPLVYKQVYEGACRHCIRLYLTAGLGSKPVVFKLSKLEANGTNIGKKVQDWKATLQGVHPYCRCHLYHIPKGYVWNEEKQIFTVPEKFDRKVERKSKIKITVGDKTFEV